MPNQLGNSQNKLKRFNLFFQNVVFTENDFDYFY